MAKIEQLWLRFYYHHYHFVIFLLPFFSILCLVIFSSVLFKHCIFSFAGNNMHMPGDCNILWHKLWFIMLWKKHSTIYLVCGNQKKYMYLGKAFKRDVTKTIFRIAPLTVNLIPYLNRLCQYFHEIIQRVMI